MRRAVTTNLIRDDTGKAVVQGGPNATCVALVAAELRRRRLPTAHLISVGGWNAPHPDTSFSGVEWWRAWREWNEGHVASQALGFAGFDGFDWVRAHGADGGWPRTQPAAATQNTRRSN